MDRVATTVPTQTSVARCASGMIATARTSAVAASRSMAASRAHPAGPEATRGIGTRRSCARVSGPEQQEHEVRSPPAPDASGELTSERAPRRSERAEELLALLASERAIRPQDHPQHVRLRGRFDALDRETAAPAAEDRRQAERQRAPGGSTEPFRPPIIQWVAPAKEPPGVDAVLTPTLIAQ
jgi:hypothetical protein